jgi:predicted MFS family arabinose efflux permease
MLPFTVWGLALGQALLITGNILLISVNALIGQRLAPQAELATLPVAVQFIGLMAATLPAAQIMRLMGRKFGFSLGNVIGIGGGLLACLAIVRADFALFCVSTTLLGVAIGVGQQYRFAATEACAPGDRPRAISLVMAGGVLAAIIGPTLAVWSDKLWPQPEFLGAFAALVALYGFNLLLIAGLPLPQPTLEEQTGPVRTYHQLLRQPKLITAIVAGAIGYGVMILVMTATPIAMHQHHHDFRSTASVIQWHVLGMFLPSFITGRLIARWGEVAIIQVGCGLLAGCVALAQTGTDYWFFWFSLVALGVGWNFTFIGATSLLTTSYLPAEKARVQGANDFLVFGFSAIASLLAGHLQTRLGWSILNLAMLPAIMVAMWLVWRNGRLSAERTEISAVS